MMHSRLLYRLRMLLALVFVYSCPCAHAQESASLTYTIPSAWQKTSGANGIVILTHAPGTSDSDRDRSYRLVILPTVPITGSLAKTWHDIWDGFILKNFHVYVGTFKPLPLQTKLPNGLPIAFDGELMAPNNGPNNKTNHVFLYLIAIGDKAIPLIGVEDYGHWGGKTREGENILQFFASLRVPDAKPTTAPLVDRAALVGTWDNSFSGASASYVTASGAHAGDASSGSRADTTLKADGTFTTKLLVKISGRFHPPATITGRWKLSGDELTLTPEKVTGSANDQPMRYRLLGVGPNSKGETVLLCAKSRVPLIFEGREDFGIWTKP